MDFFKTRRRHHRSAGLRARAAKAEHANIFTFGNAFKNDIDVDQSAQNRGLKRKYRGGYF
jgi:hypothetical protein